VLTGMAASWKPIVACLQRVKDASVNLVIAPIVKARCPGRFVRRHLLCDLQFATVLEVGRIPVRRNVWHPISVLIPATSARRRIILQTSGWSR